MNLLELLNDILVVDEEYDKILLRFSIIFLSFLFKIDDQIENLFNKIDYNAEHEITWDELSTFLQLNFDEKADAEYRLKEISFIIPAKIQKTPHRYPCSTIVLSADHQYLALGSVC